MSEDRELDTTGGRFPLFDYRLRQDGREWTVLHTGTVLNGAWASTPLTVTSNGKNVLALHAGTTAVQVVVLEQDSSTKKTVR